MELIEVKHIFSNEIFFKSHEIIKSSHENVLMFQSSSITMNYAFKNDVF